LSVIGKKRFNKVDVALVVFGQVDDPVYSLLELAVVINRDYNFDIVVVPWGLAYNNKGQGNIFKG